jgi:TetR/AcrR family transcriptional regulator, transcriptional repressor for nem operon
MKVTKAQVEENRAHIVATASALFRERGYDGIGIAELMAAAGFTHGGFYKHFGSKADLMAEAAATTISGAVADSAGSDLVEFFESYVSRAHRDARDVGCTMAALCGDAARQPVNIKATFAAGIDGMVRSLEREVSALRGVDHSEARAMMIDTFAHAVGAVVLSRACPDDSPLADEILEVCRRKILASLLPSGRNKRAKEKVTPAARRKTGRLK